MKFIQINFVKHKGSFIEYMKFHLLHSMHYGVIRTFTQIEQIQAFSFYYCAVSKAVGAGLVIVIP